MSQPVQPSGRIAHAMTVDVEDYFQVAAFEDLYPVSSWDGIPTRVEANTQRILDSFDQAGVRATFFCLGWVAERCAPLIREIAERGHEVANHGYAHQRIGTLTRGEFRDDIRRAKSLLEDTAGCAVRGYRAPSYSITPETHWAHEEIRAAGHVYSSSVYPVRHDLYGIPDAPRAPYEACAGLTEVPITTLRWGGRNWPIGGGGYFRLLPYPLYRKALQRFEYTEGRSGLFYFHPWEIDTEQPRTAGAPWRSRFRHYLNLERMESRLHALLRDFRWGRMDHLFMPAEPIDPQRPPALQGVPV